MAIWLALAAVACLEQGCFKDPYQPPLLVELSRQGGRCRVEVGGRDVGPGALADAARQRGSPRAILITGKDVPKACLSSAVKAVHRGGVSATTLALRVA